MSYRQRSPSPDRRPVRRYSPSREVSHSPPPPLRRYDDGPAYPPSRGSRYSPGPASMGVGAGRYGEHGAPSRRYDSPPPPPRARYGSRSPPYRRYGDSPPPRRRYSPSPPPLAARNFSGYRDESSMPPPRRGDDRDRYDDRRPVDRYDDRPPYGGMAADREEEYPSRGGIPPPRRQRAEELWERGRNVEELPVRIRHEHNDPAGVRGNWLTIQPVSASGPSWDDSRPRRGHQGSEPNKDVIFIGLDEEITDKDFINHLRYEHRAMIDSVKFVRKNFPDTGRVQCIAFAAFASLDGAQEFVEANSPAILWPALYEYSEPRKVRIDYAAPHQPGGEHAPRPPYAPADPIAHAPHDGMRDVGQATAGNRVLLLRGLDATTYGDEVIRRFSEEIARLVDKPSLVRTAEETITRAVMLVDRVGSQSWGMCFVELVTPELAGALLPFLTFPVHQPRGFIIGQSPVAVSFASQASFLPVPAGPLGGQFLIRATRKGGIGSETVDQPDGEWVRYWHEQGGAVVSFPKSGKPVLSPEPPVLPADVKAFLGHLSGAFQAPGPAAVTPSTGPAGPIAGSGLLDLNKIGMQPIKIGAIGSLTGIGGITPGSKGGKRKDDAAIIPLVVGGKNVLGEDEDDVDDRNAVDKDTVLLSRTRGVGMILPTSGRKVAKNINKWNTKQKEIAAPVEVNPHAPPAGVSDANRVMGVRPLPSTTTSARTGSTNQTPPTDLTGSPAAADSFDYTDLSNLSSTGKAACLLCQRQFKSEDMVRKHVAQSDLHKTNLLDSAACEAGQTRKNAAVQAATMPAPASAGGEAAVAGVESTDASTEPKYRDRAAERRIAFNQPEKPSYRALQAMASSSSSHHPGAKRKFAEGPSASAPPPPPKPEPAVAPGKDESNLGNQLLAKMGWKSGTGLGSSEQGRVEPVMVQQFEARAGLGASKGVEAGRYEGKEGHKRRALDMAEQRYHGSGSGSAK